VGVQFILNLFFIARAYAGEGTWHAKV